ncbi:sodium:proton antiporter NhaD [Psychrosphaera sp. B3R10]|uniref:Sodium:proton antiporter NhaD n=1 Tax=Psychrosphaera algicola TaxID=3023714 RepID=A0ABT5FHN0_9GAMM|nr:MULTISPECIES: sodium:proton antiporter NhaD [unclassified Psychrosphaera]MBU2880780.1 sodium:proton antiporter NhaD [Psychrosphaera sp. I2R16]MBU2991474.1 sodium:proton antiporter NhaD [Psychrosphaera sp. B3R10]MDC2890710.1 sodium:proton antiporter NhaD [Psychrosphaera sp. G1-22]MDO6719366.1 sodium:proton antiporter NhaD [Psychrosphaera sp. 1_MG-2023]
MTIIICTLAIIALLLVIFEEVIHVNKAKSTLFIGTLSWLLAYLVPLHGSTSAQITNELNENILEIATLWLFLMAAMTFVAYLNSKGFISNLVQRLLPKKMSERKFMLLIGGFSFLFSSFADNVTATLVSVAVIASLDIPARQRLKYATLIIFAVNSGGVSLITGDVTTLMIFLEGKVSIANLLLLIIPSFTAVLVLALLLARNMRGELTFEQETLPIERNDKIIASVFLVTIFSTLFLNALYQIPPVLTFLFGLSCMFLIAQYLVRKTNKNVLNYIREIEFDTLLFFLGVLLIVGILKEVGVLNQLTKIYTAMDYSVANYILGMLSAILDNVPLTAALLKADIEMDVANWLALTYATGVGGSMLVIGSAAGIIAMSKVKELNFISYLSMFGYLIVAYSVGYWLSYGLTSTVLN